MQAKETFDLARSRMPRIIMAVLWGIAVVGWLTTRASFFLYSFGYIGSALGIGLGVYSALPKRQKIWGCGLAQFLVGTYMVVFCG